MTQLGQGRQVLKECLMLCLLVYLMQLVRGNRW